MSAAKWEVLETIMDILSQTVGSRIPSHQLLDEAYHAKKAADDRAAT